MVPLIGLKFTSGGFTIRQVMIAPTESLSVNLEVKVPDTAKPQDYLFDVKVVTADGGALPNLRVDVTVQADMSTTGLKMTTDNPDLCGQQFLQFHADRRQQCRPGSHGQL